MQRLRSCVTRGPKLVEGLLSPYSSATMISTHGACLTVAARADLQRETSCSFNQLSMHHTAAGDTAAQHTMGWSSRNLECDSRADSSTGRPSSSSAASVSASGTRTSVQQGHACRSPASWQLHACAPASQRLLWQQASRRSFAAAAEGMGGTGHNSCWRCSADMPPHTLFFCPFCSVILSADTSADFFSVMGM